MKKRTSSMSRRIVSLLMSMVLTLTLVTPAAFATEVVGGSGTTIVEGDTNPADANPSGDNEGKDDENKDTEHGGDEQPTNPGDEDKNPGEGEDDVNASSNEADTQEGEGTDTPVVAQRTVTLEKWNKNAAYDVKIVIPAATSEPGEGETTEAPGEGENAGSGNETLSTEYTGTDEKITLKLTTEDYTDNPIIYIKSSADEVVAETTPKLGDDGTLEYVFTGEETDITLYYGTKDDFVSAWYGDGSATKYTIRSAEELANFAQLVNSENDFSGKTITLGKNIVLDGIDWTPIGTAESPFKGTFTIMGNYSISNLPNDLFGVVEGGTVKSVTISGGKGRLVGELKSGKVENCMSTAKVDSSDENAAVGGLVGMAETNATVSSSYYYNADSINVPAVGGSGTVTNCFYLAETSTFDKKGTADDIGARTAEEFQLGRVAYELGGSSYVWVYDTTNKAEKMPQLGRSSGTMAVANELKLTKPDNQPEGVVVTLGNDSDKKTLTDAAGNQYYYAASGYPNGVSDVPVTFTAPTGYQIVFAPAATQVGGTDYCLRITGSNVEYTYSLVKADIRWYESAGKEKNYVLKSADELMGFCLLANGSIDGESKNFDGWTLSLGNSIDLENSEWKPIPSFAGEFNGMSHEIKGLNVNYTDDDSNSKTAGMFEKLDSTGKILSLAVSGSVKADGKINNVGGIVGTTAAGSEIRFCRSNITVEVDATNGPTTLLLYGGVAGKVQGAISNCLNEGTITVKNINRKNCYIGGVAGQVSSAANLCWNTGSVTASGTANKNICTGGIVGSGAATNCYNNGSVTGATGKNKYMTGGISGNGNVTNSYNLGAVSGRGAAGITGKGTVTNSYYLCKLNGSSSIKMAYVNNAPEAEVKYNEADKAYTVGEDAALLVDTLNKNRDGNTPWFVNQDEGVYLPIHVLDWTGKQDERFIGKIITITYEPNGGVNKDGVDAPISASVTLTPNLSAGGFKAEQYTILAANDETLGFKHENGTIKATPWNTARDGTGTGYNAGSSIDISASESEGITLYAQWDAIWVGTGTKSDPYQIPSIDELTKLQEQVNENGFSYTGKWFRLTNNIDLNNELWTPIGVDSLHSFGGSLDGGGKTISGLKVETNGALAGLFGSVRGTYGVPMTMRDLTLKNGSVKFTSSGTSCSGGLVAAVEGETVLELRNVVAENLTVSGGIFGSGGLLGRGRVAMTNCHNRGGSVTGSYAGGLAGMGYSNLQDHVLAGCTNSAKVVGKRTAGGMTGNETHSDGSYTSCANSGSISATQGYASGIAAGGSYERCSNSGAVTGQEAAGICVNGSKATNCSNTGAVTGTGTGTGYAAGILTNDGYGGTVEFCWNTGSVEASTPVKAFGILYGRGAYNRVRNSFSYVPGANIGLAPTELKEENVSDSYYLADKKDSVSSAGEWASADDFASGKVAWGVGGKGEGSQGGTGQDAKLGWWKQDKNDEYPTLLDNPDMSKRYYRTDVDCGTGGEVELTRNASSAVKEISSKEAVYGPAGTSVTIKATPKDNTFGLKSLTWTHNGQTDTLPTKGTPSIVIPAESNVTIHAEFASVGPGGNGGYYYGGSGDGTGTGDKDDEGLQDGLNMDVEYDIKGLVLGAYAEWGSNGGNKSFQKWLEENPNVVRALLTNSLDNMATAAVGKKTDEAKDLAALLLASLNEHTGVDGKDGDTIAKALQKYIDSGSEEVFSAWLTGGGGMASGTYESIYGQYASSLAALADRLYSKWEASGTSMTFPVWLDSQQVSMDSLSENADEPDTDSTNDPQTSDAPDDVPDGQDTEGGASGNSVWEIIGTVVRENPILVWSIVAVVAALIIVGAVRRYHKVKRDERDDVASKK